MPSLLSRPLSPRGFLAAAAAFGTALLGLLWLWVAFAPLAFLDSEYAAWAAKQQMLARCDLGEVLVLGDSRAAAGVLPRLMPAPASNLALGGGEPIEALTALRRALACPNKPRRVLLSFNPGQFTRPDLFWERTVRFGFLDAAAVSELAQASRATGDWSVFENGHGDGLNGAVRAALYAVRFPGLYFTPLAKGGVFLRLFENRRALADSLASRGQYFFGTAPGCDEIAVEGHLDSFRPLPVLDLYFDRILRLLADQHIPTVFVPMPVNEATLQSIRPEVARGFAAYLRRYQARYPNLAILGPALNGWPDALFGDAFSHLNPRGAVAFSRKLGACLKGGACMLDWREDAAQTAAARKQEGA